VSTATQGSNPAETTNNQKVYMVLVWTRKPNIQFVTSGGDLKTIFNVSRNGSAGAVKRVFATRDEAVRYACSELERLIPIAWARRGKCLAKLLQLARRLGYIAKPNDGSMPPTIEFV